MTLYDKLFLTGYFLVIIFIQVKWQAALFKRDITISHFKHGLYYALTVVPALWMFWSAWWQVPLIALLERIAFFDPVQNVVRGNSILGYNGKGTTGSWLDQLENSLSSTWVKVLKVVYVIIFIVAIIFIK